MRLQYVTLPFCTPADLKYKLEDLGEVGWERQRRQQYPPLQSLPMRSQLGWASSECSCTRCLYPCRC